MKLEHLEYRWHQLMRRQKAPAQYIVPLWREILSAYTNENRHYHSLEHLVDLFTQADQLKAQIEDFDTLELSIWYHDIIYQCLRKDNEEKSALFAKYRLEAINYPRQKLVRCYEQINATKTHKLPANSKDLDLALFLDFDLSILGKDWPIYENYCAQIRKEYSIFPNFLYNRGRKKVIKQLLNLSQIFKTNYYVEKYEKAARNNLERELEKLSE